MCYGGNGLRSRQCPLFSIPWVDSAATDLDVVLGQIHVNIIELLNIACTLVATTKILGTLECSTTLSNWDNQCSLVMIQQHTKH